MVILKTGTPQGNNTLLSGMNILRSSPDRRSGDRVTAMATQALSTVRASRQKVETVDDRVKVIIKNILKGEVEPAIDTFTGYAISDYCGDEWCVEPHDEIGEIEALYWLIRHNVKYKKDPYGADLYRSALRALQSGSGDCDCLAALAGACYRNMGYPVKVKVIRTHGNDTFHHVYILVGYPSEDPTKWIAVDPSYYESPGQEAPGIVEQKIFEVS